MSQITTIQTKNHTNNIKFKHSQKSQGKNHPNGLTIHIISLHAIIATLDFLGNNWEKFTRK
jgi:hypothetical protein